MEHPVWQIAAGAPDRLYSDCFLEYGVALLGPGDAGAWSRSPRKPIDRFVDSFAGNAKEGDPIVLRLGKNKVIAVAIIASEYQYLEQFDDVNGWDLQHARRVRWMRLEREHVFSSYVFGANPSRFSRTWNREVIALAQTVINSEPSNWKTAPLPPLPEPEPRLSDPPSAVAPIVADALALFPQFWDKARYGFIPSEDELIAHFAVPFLRALGWPKELVAVKWRGADIVLFNKLPRNRENIALIIEAKRLDTAAESAFEQAKRYARKFETECNLLVTDGIRYRLFAFEKRPIAYANLWRLKARAQNLFDKLIFRVQR
jgi:hypothetical protein